ncbi:peptide/nickel transport system permease protein [Arthrobacter ginsengisoli]|uniref:Peptide/nickel transport system permease protein n=1 Tax=Arthrobacter ginsengisoli TaxID=1356565 RepID=A0ABU1UI85_9MICC|nr:ABC transporter permease [Arthrobacter ginsengisoli]MDR7084840.1 peptide/nickel transport system permease protein [Arthrobacter ginsengisoli]
MSTLTKVGEIRVGVRKTPGYSRGSASILAFGVPLGLIALVTLLAPLLPLPGPNVQVLSAALRPPVWLPDGTWSNPLGTDQLGRDVLSRVVYGGQLTFIIALSGMVAGAVPGILLGLLAGYRRGWADAVISRFVEAQLALPFILLAIAIIAAQGRSLTILIVVLALVGWAQYARVIRAETMSLRERPFIVGLRCAGVPTWRIMLRHLLPNLAGTATVLATLQMGTIILAESALSFLGLGVVAPDISWGAMLADGRDQLTMAWWVAALPGLAITVVVLLVNLLGDALRSRFDPKKRSF